MATIESVQRAAQIGGDGLRLDRSGDETYLVFDIQTTTPVDDITLRRALVSEFADITPHKPGLKGNAHPTDEYVVCDGEYYRQVSSTVWELRSHYTREIFLPNGAPKWHYDNPLDVPVRWDESEEFRTEAIDRDIHGAPIQNSVQQSYDPPPTEEVGYLRLQLWRNEPGFSHAFYDTFRRSINSVAWQIQIRAQNADGDWVVQYERTVAARRACCRSITPQLTPYGPGWFYTVHYDFLIVLPWPGVPADVEQSWRRRFLDQGTRQFKEAWTGEGSFYEAIKDADGDQVFDPVRLRDGYPINDPTDEGSWRFHDTKAEVDFAGLGFSPPT